VAHSANGTKLQIETFRDHVDADGILREGALPEPPVAEAYLVFAQRDDARIELPAWQRHAESFFDARLGLTVDKRYPEGFPRVDAAPVVIAPRSGGESVRLCYGRPRTDDDLRAAEDADSRAGNTGLALLAKRCRWVWLVVREEDLDRAALLLSAIVASVVLGPILSSPESELFGVKTARSKLETFTGPYR